MHYPSSTYRVQLNSEFTFRQLASIIDYLHDLGISTIYAAPVTASRKDSSHGYDVVDPSVINPQIGTLEEWRELSQRLKAYGMSWLQDIVPNHMSFSMQNRRLADVLERGADSPYYLYFDIDWKHQEAEGKVWIPVLGKEWESCLADGEFRIAFSEEKGFEMHYFDQHFPLAVSALTQLLAHVRETKENQGLGFLLEDLIRGASRKELASWLRHKEKYSREIAAQFMPQVQQVLSAVNADHTKLGELLKLQPYKLRHWQTSEKQMNYRRFFAVNDLICLRMEDKNVFDDYHAFFFALYKEQLIQGLRIDHIDGLYHPLEYVKKLRKKMGDECYLIVEKILEYNEDLGQDWNIEGTSGYEFLSFANRLLTDQQGAEKLRQFYHAFTLSNISYDALTFQNKYKFLYSQMQGELDNLMTLMVNLGLTEQLTLENKRIRHALGLFLSAFPIYRIYPFMFPIAEEAMRFVHKAFDIACNHDATYKAELTFIRSLFYEEQAERAEAKMKFIMRLMQFTGPLAAKGVEDTTFYVYNPLISHNEVGDAPVELACTVEEFHDKMSSRQKNNPYSLNNSSTHDTKRGEDARARLNVLSHLHHEWEGRVMQWHQENKKFTAEHNNRRYPSLNDEYYIYQSLLGSFPVNCSLDETFIERTRQFMLKAMREAKVETTYTQNDEAYESACLQFITSILSEEHTFLQSFLPFLNQVNRYAAIYSLSQSLIKITAPGIPDIYQGSELWELSYVDPDNRRQVDYECRMDLLQEMNDQEGTLITWLRNKRQEGAEKLFVTKKLLHVRKNNPELFIKGAYVPLTVHGQKGRCVAYARVRGSAYLVIIVPIAFDVNEQGDFTTSWEDVFVKLPEGMPSVWKNEFTGHFVKTEQAFSVAEAFRHFPVAVYSSGI